MTQSIISDSLATFTRSSNPQLSEFFKNNGGLCFAFSLCYAVMRIIGKLPWWRAALQAVANWDGRLESLDAAVFLPGQEGEQALKDIFIKLSNYLSFHQFYPAINDLGPDVLLNVDGIFEVVVDKKILKVRHNKKRAGDLSKDQLAGLLNKKIIKNKIILIINDSHAITGGFDDSGWFVYNPNYDHRDSGAMYKEFNTQEEFINEIIHIQGSSLTIQCCSLDQKNRIEFPYYSEFINLDNVMDLVKGRGLHHIARATPDALYRTIMLVREKKGADEFARALSLSGKSGWTGLHMVARFAPAALPDVIVLAKESKEGAECIARAMALQNKDGWTGLQMVACNVPAALPGIIALAKESKAGAECIARAVSLQNKDGWTGLQVVASCASAALPGIIALAKESKEGAECITRAMALQNKDGWAGLHAIIHYAPAALPEVIALAKESKGGAQCIARAMPLQDKDGWTGLHMIAHYAPAILPEVIVLAKESKEGAECIMRAMPLQKEGGATGLQMIAHYAPAALPEVIALAKESKTGVQCMARAMSLQDKDGWTGLHTIIHYAPASLPGVMALLKESKEGAECMARALSLQTEDGWTGLHMIARYTPASLPEALTLVAHSKEGALKILQALSSEEKGTHQTGRNILKGYAADQIKNVISAFTVSLKELELSALMNLQKDLRRAASQAGSPYRGICKNFMFFNKCTHYVKTRLWKQLCLGLETEIKIRNLLPITPMSLRA